MIRILSHPQDLHDFLNEVKNMSYPIKILAESTKPIRGTDGYETWLRQNSYFHRGIVPTYSELSGLGYDECKDDLQRRFACVTELKDEYEVMSIGDMSNSEISAFIERCTHFLASEFGAVVDEILSTNINKTKRVKKWK